ncbi:beta-L-arabinofuranosidase domain-containing protein [Mucilaginibacter antarcticus]|uniref:Beta-L-arabinofuranosidase domain-containing protein n=2 Tax=Mucilaginibacter antarcticus TaxID=1855725 RepID=A0ABW5XK57_9SPHI
MRSYKLLTPILTGLLLSANSFAQTTSKYNFNRAPLKPGAYVQLPLGSIKAKGWLLKQLELQKEGFTGHAEELYPGNNDLGSNSDWLGGTGNGWEKVPYYVKGLTALAYTLNDTELKAKASKWITYTLEHQQENGLFGPPKMKDWWPRMPFMYAAQSYYEATNDARVVPFLSKYFKYELANLDTDPLSSWGRSRAGDNIELVLWVYNKTGESFLLELANKLKTQAYQWQDIFSQNLFHYYGNDYQPRHMVNVAQALKFPAVVAQFAAEPVYATAMQKGIAHMMHDNGQPEGLAAGTEHMSGNSSVEGVETCTVVEWMQSLETASRNIHDANIGDHLERVAFNALPAQYSRDLKNHSYYTLPNQIKAANGQHGFYQDYGNGLLLSPYSGFPCCRYNLHMGWPYFVKNSALATPEGGVAINTYGPMEISAFVAKGTALKITESTNYPFEEHIYLSLSLPAATTFPLVLRIPAWCASPKVLVNGKPVAGVKPGQLYTINRKWSSADKVTLNFPMQIKIEKQVNNAVSIVRGPLVYSLKIKQTATTIKEHKVAGFVDTEIVPASAWNYGLTLNNTLLANQFVVVKSAMPANPFEGQQSPVTLKAKAKQIPAWTLDYRQTSAFEVPHSPVASTQKTEDIELVPFGSQNIRLSIFPTIGSPKYITDRFTEDFTNNTSEGWVIYGGRWFYKDDAVNCGELENKSSGTYGSKIVATNTKFDDFTFAADITTTGAGDAGLIFRVSDAAIGADAYKGYYVGINPTNKTLEFGKSSDNKWMPIASVTRTLFKLDQTYRIKVKAKGTRFEVYIDNETTPAIAASDGEYKSGNVGLRTYRAMAKIDKVEVIKL